MNDTYDVIIVGARLAGSTLAYELSKRGFGVLLLDRAEFPSDTLSTHNFFNNSLLMLKDMGVLDKLLETNTPVYRRAKIEFEDAVIDGRFPDVDGETRCLCIRRTHLDGILLEHARSQAGVTVMEGFKVSQLVMEGDTVAGVIGQNRSGNRQEYRAKLVVGADGRLSAVRRLANSERLIGVPTGYASYVCYLSNYKQEGEIGLEFYRKNGNYAIVFPTSDNLYVFGTMFPMDDKRTLERFQTDAEAGIRELIDRDFAGTTLQQGLAHSKVAEHVKGLHGYDNHWYRGMGKGWALVGDAICFKDPTIGQGMHDALFGARLLAEILAGKDDWNGSWDELAVTYQQEMERKLMSRFHLGCQFSVNVPFTEEQMAVYRLVEANPDLIPPFFGIYNYAFELEDFQALAMKKLS